MQQGGGKYEVQCTHALLETRANGIVLIVLGGYNGSGFSIAMSDPNLLVNLPRLLREVATEIEAEIKGKGAPSA
jgi:hypothetical protein